MEAITENSLKTPKVNLENWGHSSYNTQKHKAFISLGGDADGEKIYFIYTVTVTDSVSEEIFQKVFKSLDEAVAFLNKSYGHWEFRDASQNSGGGCDTCSAH